MAKKKGEAKRKAKGPTLAEMRATGVTMSEEQRRLSDRIGSEISAAMEGVRQSAMEYQYDCETEMRIRRLPTDLFAQADLLDELGYNADECTSAEQMRKILIDEFLFGRISRPPRERFNPSAIRNDEPPTDVSCAKLQAHESSISPADENSAEPTQTPVAQDAHPADEKSRPIVDENGQIPGDENSTLNQMPELAAQDTQPADEKNRPLGDQNGELPGDENFAKQASELVSPESKPPSDPGRGGEPLQQARTCDDDIELVKESQLEREPKRRLTPQDRRLLNALMVHKRSASYESLRGVWGGEVTEQGITKALKRLREKLPLDHCNFEISVANYEVIWHRKGPISR